ncbi:MAG: exodeoxyribonuclease VII large subunit [Candidatus Altiarchaeota archaeon]|nr:exodeoxyribonuclease VII large subunit [Candidatus Altiarchaeota archaeon]
MDFQLIHLALAISIIGLLILAFAEEHLEPPLSWIKQINTNSLGRNVHVKGNISGFHEFKGGSFTLSLKDSSGEIDIYVPYNVALSLNNVSDAGEIEVIGSVEVYKGRLEIVVENIDGLRVIK